MGSSNSLGRRTIASLQEIERNRQIHLAKQGNLVRRYSMVLFFISP